MISSLALVISGVGIITTSVLVAFGKSISDAVIQQSCVAKLLIYNMFLSAQKIKLDPPPNRTSPHTAMIRCINRSLTSIEGGVHILGGPPGCGKSTCVSGAIELCRQRHAHKLILLLHGPELLRSRGLHAELGVPTRKRISTYVPEGSVIVIDQLDLGSFTELTIEMQGYLIELAADSVNNPTFHIILVVSKPEVFGTLMRLNGCEKFQDICRPSDFGWSVERMTLMVDHSLYSWSEADRQRLVEALHPFATPKVIYQIIASAMTCDTPLPPDAVIRSAEQRSLARQKIWKNYEEVCKGLFFSSMYIEE